MSRWRLGHQDSYVLTAIEALAGEIDRRVHAITVHVGEDTEGLRFRFWVHDHPVALAEVAEDADDALGDLDAMLQPDPVQCISEEILPGPPPPDIDGWAGRLLYLTPALATVMPHLIPATPVSDSPAPEPWMTDLDKENFYTVRAHQASLGHITATMNALTLHISEDQLGLRVWTAEPADRAVTAQIAHRLHLLLPPDHPQITTEIIPGTPPNDSYLWARDRMIYWDRRRRPTRNESGASAVDDGIPAIPARLAPFDVVRIPAGLPEQGVPAGSRAVVLEVHEDPYLAYEVEVVDDAGRTLFTGAVDPAQVQIDRPEADGRA